MIEALKVLEKQIHQESININLMLDKFGNQQTFERNKWGAPMPVKPGIKANWLLLQEYINNLHSHADIMLELMKCHAEEMCREPIRQEPR